MKFITVAFLFQFLTTCWPKSNIRSNRFEPIITQSNHLKPDQTRPGSKNWIKLVKTGSYWFKPVQTQIKLDQTRSN